MIIAKSISQGMIFGPVTDLSEYEALLQVTGGIPVASLDNHLRSPGRTIKIPIVKPAIPAAQLIFVNLAEGRKGSQDD